MILVPCVPLTAMRVISLPVQGLTAYLLTQGGTPKPDTKASVGAWQNLLAFLDDAVRDGS
jgi:hypothetical protein